MSATEKEVRRNAALAIERAIDRKLEDMRVPPPNRTCVLDTTASFRSLELIYSRKTGYPVGAEFSSTELENFETQPLPETIAKIDEIAKVLCIEYQKR